MSDPKLNSPTISVRRQGGPTDAGQSSQAKQDDVAHSVPLAEAPPLFASVHAAVANIREDARAKARQLIAEAEHALLESLRALHVAGKKDSSADDGSASEKRGEQ